MGEITRDRFARQVAIALRVAGGTDIEYDADEFCLRFKRPDGGPMVGNLVNVFAEWSGANQGELTAEIKRFVGVLVSSTETITEWEFVADRLRPVLNPSQLARFEGMTPLVREFLPFVNEMVVVDHPDKMQYVMPDDVARWGVSEARVFEQARESLAARAAWRLLDGQTGRDRIFRMPESGSDYWASHLVLDGWLAGVGDQLAARPVVFVADRSGITIVTDEPDTVGGLLEMTEKEYLDAARFISPQAYTVDDAGRVVPYRVPRDHPLWTAVHRSEVLLASREYDTQRQGSEHEAFVASYSVGTRDDGSVYSVAVWGEGVDTLLPVTDFVAVISEAHEHFLVTWETVLHRTGIAPEPGWSPPRFRARSWPSPDRLRALRAEAVQP